MSANPGLHLSTVFPLTVILYDGDACVAIQLAAERAARYAERLCERHVAAVI